MTLFWLSFADKSKPAGQRFLGACVVAGEDFGEAVEESHRLKCNPGGEIAGCEILPHIQAKAAPFAGRLLSLSECKAVEKALGEP